MSGHHHHGTGRAAAVTLAVNLALTCAKWIAFAVTRSPSLFGEAAHSTADALNPLVLWFGVRRSRRPSHARHPAGHGREAFFWGLIAAQLMFLVGAALTAAHGIETIRTGAVPARSGLAVAVMAAALLGESYSLFVSWRALRQEGSGGDRNTVLLALIVENLADILGVIMALAGYGLFLLTGDALWDGAFSLLIAALLACSSIFLMNRNRSLIIGEAVPASTEEKVRRAAARPSVAAVVSVRALMRDPHHASCRIAIRWNPAWFRSRLPAAGSFDAVAWTLAAERAERDAIADAVRAACDDIADVDVIAE